MLALRRSLLAEARQRHQEVDLLRGQTVDGEGLRPLLPTLLEARGTT